MKIDGVKFVKYILIALAVIGLLDSLYLTYEHFSGTIPPCSVGGLFDNCGTVLRSEYAEIIGIPVALFGVLHYFFLTSILTLGYAYVQQWATRLALVLTMIGFLGSGYFVYIQLFVLRALCLYCMISAIISLVLLVLVWGFERRARTELFAGIVANFYTKVLKRIFFLLDPEYIHTKMVTQGELLGRSPLRGVLAWGLAYRPTSLAQELAGITFLAPVGLAAGFDYNAQLTQILPSIGFGFHTVGTITAHACEGNPKPRLGRLPRSQSLMVNKGFRNPGVGAIVRRLQPYTFSIPVGISIGRTNSEALNDVDDAIADILQAFRTIDAGSLAHAYYELNISCPNLKGSVSFYEPESLHRLLSAIKTVHLERPVFVKMPIEKSDNEFLAMLEVITASQVVSGVIIGNLQKNRQDASFDINEVLRFPKGNFSGKPTYIRSNELIKLTYRQYKDTLPIIGCGGVFSAQDAYTKITLGASLVQLITGLVYRGPQLVAQINLGLEALLKKDGYEHIAQAIGSAHT